MMTNDTKKAVLVIGGGLLLFWLFKPKKKKMTADGSIKYSEQEDNPKERKKMDVPTMNPKSAQKNPMAKNGFIALKAYVDAYNNGEPQGVLDDLNRDFAKELRVRVYRRKSDRKLVVTDLEGKEIMVNNG